MSSTPQNNTPRPTIKGKAFFDRADQVAETGNWDFALEMYLEGIRREPANVERGHEPLRLTAVKRKAAGGKAAGMMDQLKHRPVKDPLETLINAEWLLGKDPGSMVYMEQVLKAAQAMSLNDVVRWMCNIMLVAMRQVDKPSKRTLIQLGKALKELGDYGTALQALDHAKRIDPADGEIAKLLSDTAGEFAIRQGKFVEDGHKFTDTVADMAEQTRLAQDDSMVKDRAFLLQQIERAKTEYHQAPTVPGKVNAVVDALLKIEDEEHENQAVDILTQAHHQIGAYQFKLRIGEVRIKQMTRRWRELMAKGDKEGAAAQLKRQLAFELEEYAERATNYPTDLDIKFELGRRQFLAGRYDEAIGSFQQAQRNPRRRLGALSQLGQAFHRKGMLREAAETYAKALEGDVSEDKSKELRFNLGNVLVDMGSFKEAEDQFSQVAQLDYNYRDVRQRLDNVRKKLGTE
ncbi:MAG: hypothetical protein ABFD92_00835 [Planctomycetaceae bacterium]|nr:hypothetical protein [Planctomycetaceae bacterium]